MPTPLLHLGATVKCAHAGEATPSAPFPRVTLGGQPVVTQPTIYAVAGCTLPPPPAANGPCVTAQWTTAALRVKAGGLPVLLMESQATCVPTGTPLLPVTAQVRVVGI
jgi:hypothetical protein